MPTSSILPKPNSVPPTLPPSVEQAYRQKCIDLKRRMNQVEEANDSHRLRKVRLNRGVMKLRLERAFLLERLAGRTAEHVEDSEGSPSPPSTPQEKPLRLKRGHRKSENPAANGGGGGGGGNSPSSTVGAEPAAALFAPTTTTATTSASKHVANHNDHDNVAQSALSPSGGAGTPTPAADNKSANGSGSGSKASSSKKRKRSSPANSKNSSKAQGSTRENANSNTSAPNNNNSTRRPPPASAYILYCMEVEPDMILENADDPDFDIHQALARSWRDLGAEGQRPWMEKEKELKAGRDEKDKEKEKEKEKKGEDGDRVKEEEEKIKQQEKEKDEEMETEEGQASKRRTGGFTAVNR
ncbi:MAG: hypothetical protein M1816_004365 [Peltula sp. TS41687]|nr:MAG: hypothetical protein M1816_004365 [Peltula sp. TS41687]